MSNNFYILNPITEEIIDLSEMELLEAPDAYAIAAKSDDQSDGVIYHGTFGTDNDGHLHIFGAGDELPHRVSGY